MKYDNINKIKLENEDVRNFILEKQSTNFLSSISATRLYALAKKAGERKSTCLEIGSGYGCSGVIIGTAIKEKGGKLISIDSFLTPPHYFIGDKKNKESWNERNYRKNLKRFGIKPILIIGNSIEIVPLFRDKLFDLIWIDGGHKYKIIKKDILNSIPKLKEGGILCGHDFRSMPDVPENHVKTAVREIFGKNFKRIGGRIWVMN